MQRSASKIALLIGCALAASSPLVSQAQQPTTTLDTSPGKATATETTRATATVTAVDPKTRALSLKQANGNVVEMTAGPEVRNFDQIKVGDQVQAEFVRALSLELKKAGTSTSGGVSSV